MDPAAYEAWYHTPRGAWIAGREFALLWRLARPRPGESLLDLGTGTGHFARRFSAAGLGVTGLDPDPAALDFARRQAGGIDYVQGDMRALPGVGAIRMGSAVFFPWGGPSARLGEKLLPARLLKGSFLAVIIEKP